jgi:hypothetical protein
LTATDILKNVIKNIREGSVIKIASCPTLYSCPYFTKIISWEYVGFHFIKIPSLAMST